MKGKITRQLLMDSLKKVGIQQGDTVFIHSDLRPFGFPEEITRRDEILRFYYQGIRDVIGEDGTIAVPAYNYEYARYNLPFDADTSGVSLPLGSFSQYITALPDSIRSLNPLQSIAAIGPNAKKISGGSSLSGYGVTSPWHWLHQLNALFLFLGAPFQSMTFVHHLEQLVGVPHLYFKIFDTPILKNGKTIQGMPISAVRYLDFTIEYNLDPFKARLNKKGFLQSAKLGDGEILTTPFQNVYEEGVEALSANPFFFLKEVPPFIPGKIPFDGATGSANEQQ